MKNLMLLTPLLMKYRSIFYVVKVTFCLSLIGCQPQKVQEPDPTSTTKVAVSSGQVISIFSSNYDASLISLLDNYSNETGTTIELVIDDSAALIERLEQEGSAASADLFLATDASSLWQASRKGLLQQINSPTIDANIPPKYRDEESRWTGLSLEVSTIFYNTDKVKAAGLVGYENLADNKWKGKLCLRTSNHAHSRSLVASMINNVGESRVAEVLKGWKRNLATEVFIDDASLLKAMSSGECAVGIANMSDYIELKKQRDIPIKPFWANQQGAGIHANISGAGVVTNADNPAGALNLIEWLSSEKMQRKYDTLYQQYPANINVQWSDTLRDLGTFKADNVHVSRFGELESQAIELITKSEYQ